VIILDTNVLSELMRSQPDPAVFAWVAAQQRAMLYTTSVNQAEILYGIAILPGGPTAALGLCRHAVGGAATNTSIR
jgi:predicted nucleic acid-binding protein